MSELARLAAIVLLGTLSLLVLAVWVDEPAYNFFPTALVVAAAVLAVLVLTTPIAIYAALLFGLLVPVGSFTFQVHRNRSAEAAYRHAWALDRSIADTHLELGDLLRLQGRRVQAIDAYATASRLDPQLVAAREGLHALTDEERRFLTRVSARYRNK